LICCQQKPQAAEYSYCHSKLSFLLLVGLRFLALILFSTLVDYVVGVSLGKEQNLNKRKILLWISILVNLGFLGFFKYYNFFLDNFKSAFTFFGSEINDEALEKEFQNQKIPIKK